MLYYNYYFIYKKYSIFYKYKNNTKKNIQFFINIKITPKKYTK